MVKYICGKVGAVPKVMSATLNVVVSMNSTTVCKLIGQPLPKRSGGMSKALPTEPRHTCCKKYLRPKKNNILNFNIFYNFSIMAL